MSENLLQIIAICKMLWITGFTALYGFGGIKNKYLRRFVGSFWMGLGIYGFSYGMNNFHWFYLFYPALLCASLHIGYGGDDVATKIRKRSIYGMALAVSALPLCLGSHLWALFGLHVVLCVMASVLLGVFNPMRNARDEETMVAVLSTIIPLFLI